jgi:hypothetical protein
MATKPKLKSIIPKFATEREAADWFAAHSAADFWHELLPVPPFKLPPEQAQMIRDRHQRRRKSAISIRLDPDQITTAQTIAARKSIGYQTQLRLWIAEGIRREANRA